MSIALIVLCAIPLAHFFTRYSWSYDHRAVARAIAQQSAPGDAIMVVHPYEAFFYRWYLGEQLPIRGLVFTALEDQEGYVIKPPPVELERARARIGAAAAVLLQDLDRRPVHAVVCVRRPRGGPRARLDG